MLQKMNLSSIKTIDPASFAFVMATGSVSIAFNLAGWSVLSLIFLAIGIIGYISLVAIFGSRIFLYPKQVVNEMWNTLALLKYLTFCAGSNSLAVACILAGYDRLGLILGAIGISSTIVMVYNIFFYLFFSTRQSIQAINPFWLLMPVSSHSSGIVITTLWNHETLSSNLFLLVSFGFWSFGILTYLIFMSLNIYRMFFLEFTGKDLYPAYWICMGAAAIAVVDGSNLTFVENPPLYLNAAMLFIRAMDLMLWCWATAWIVILCSMELAKYCYFKISYCYHPSLWTIVFPLGMYTSATFKLSYHADLDDLKPLVPICLWITAACWAFIGASGLVLKNVRVSKNKESLSK